MKTKQFLHIKGKQATLLKGGKFYETVEGNLIHIPTSGGPVVLEPNKWLELQTESVREKRTKSGANHAFMKPLKITSPELRAIVGADTSVRTEVIKKLWAYIKTNELQDLKNRRNINVGKNPLTKKIFGDKEVVNRFEMTKMVSKHLK